MPPHKTPPPARTTRWTRSAARRTALGAFVVLLATALLFGATAKKPEDPGNGNDNDNSGDDAIITVTFDEDGLGYNVTSTKDLSNIVVDFCVQADFKYDGLTGKNFTGSENTSVAGLWVKSGNNGGNNSTEGYGEYIANEAVDCTPDEPTCEELDNCVEPTCEELDNCVEPTCEELNNCVEPTCEELDNCVEPTCEELNNCVEETCEDRGDCDDPVAEVPFFTNPTSLVLGTLGAVGGALAILVRKNR